MPTDIAVTRCIAEAEKRLDAMQVLCEILTGQVKGERRQLAGIKAALASDCGHGEEGDMAPGQISPNMLVH